MAAIDAALAAIPVAAPSFAIAPPPPRRLADPLIAARNRLPLLLDVVDAARALRDEMAEDDPWRPKRHTDELDALTAAIAALDNAEGSEQ